MMGHKICLFGEIRKIISELYLLLLLIWSSDEVNCQSEILTFWAQLFKALLANKTGSSEFVIAQPVNVRR